MAGTANSIVTENVLAGGEVNANNLLAGSEVISRDITYALVGEAGSRIQLTISASDYKMTAKLQDKYGNIIYTSNAIDLPIESMVVNGSYDSANQRIILTQQNGGTVLISLADLQAKITASNKISSDFIDDINHANKFVTVAEKDAWNAKYDKPSGGIPSTDLTSDVQDSLEKAESAVQDEDLQMVETIDIEDGSQITDGTGFAQVNKIYGNTQQDTYEGNQLVDFNSGILSPNTTKTFENDILTVSSSNRGYASVRFTITDLYKNNASKYLKMIFDSIDRTNYGGGAIAQVAVTYNDSTPTQYKAVITTNGVSQYSQIPSDTSNVKSAILCVYSNNTSTTTGDYSVTITKPMLQFGTESKTYEPYVGGSPSPSPDYPQDVRVVTGENTINVSEKNLLAFPYGATTKTENGITWTVNTDGSITVSGTASAISFFQLYNNTSTKLVTDTTKTYTLQIGTKSSNIKLACFDYVNNNVERFRTDSFFTDYGITFTPTNNGTGQLFRLAIESGTAITTPITIYPMIIEGDYPSTLQTYEPYYTPQTYSLNLGSIELCKIGDYQDYITKSTGKNLFKPFNFTKTSTGITFAYSENGSININGTSTGNALSMYTSDATPYLITLQAGTYTISGNTEDIRLEVLNSSGVSLCIAGTNRTFTINETTNVFVRINILSGKTFNNAKVYPQLEKGSTATIYEPYGKVWCKHSKIGKIVFDGSETGWGISETNTNTFRIVNSTILSNNMAYSYDKSFVKNNYFKLYSGNIAIGNIDSEGLSIRDDKKGITIRILKSRVTDLNGFKNWLSTHNTIVYYVLATPINAQITDATLINQLNALSNMTLIDGESNITITTDNEKPKLNITYVNKGYDIYSKEETDYYLGGKQDNLISGTNIKTINNQNILGSGNLTITGESTNVKINGTSITADGVANIYASGNYSENSPLMASDDLEMVKNAEITDDGSVNDASGFAQIKKVYGNTEQNSYTGKNLFDNVYGQNKKVYTTHIDANSPLGSVDCYAINLKPNTNYTLTIDMNGYTKTGAWIAGMCFVDGNVISLLQSAAMSGITTTTFTTDSTGIVYVGHRYGFTDGETNRMEAFLQTAKIQLEQGETASNWESYVGGTASPNPDYPQQIKVVTGTNTIKQTGKNLFDNSVERKSAYVVVDIGNTVHYSNSSAFYSYVNCCYLNANQTYTISLEKNTPLSTTARDSIIVDSNGKELESIKLWKDNFSTYTFTPSYSGYLVLCVDQNSTNIQIEKGTTKTAYESYQSNSHIINLGSIELCKIGTYQDYIYKDNGKWYKHSEIGKVVLDGSESGWEKLTGSAITVNSYKLLNYISANRTDNSNPYLSNYFTAIKASQRYIDKTFFINIQSAIIFSYDEITTLADFKTWLGTHNTLVYYVLATPTDEEITDTTLISQLEETWSLFKNITNNFIITTNNSKPTLDILYAKNIDYDIYSKEETDYKFSNKQDVLVSGTNIKTINNQSLLGSGNISISSGGTATDVQVNGTSITSDNTANILTNSAYSSSNKIATMNDIPSLTNYVTNTDYATGSTGGVIKYNSGTYGSNMTDGVLCGNAITYADYSNKNNNYIIAKGTLENVITGKGLVNQTDLNNKQNTLVSGSNIKTINNQSLLGSGNIEISGGGGTGGGNQAYESVAAMKADTDLSEGDYAITLGYYSANDGGGAEYKIVTSTSNYAETLSNGKKAELIIRDDSINILQLGAKGDNTFDNTSIFQSALYSNQSNKKIIIPNGVYKTYPWGSNGANQRLNNIELIGINKPTINLIPQSTETLQGTYSGTFTVQPGYVKIITSPSVSIDTIELADGQKYYYLQVADKTILPSSLSNSNYLVGETSGIRYAVASVDTNDPDGTGTARIYLYDISSGQKANIIFNNSSNVLSENLWVSDYDNNGVWYIDFGSTTTPDYFKTTNRHIKQASTGKNARIKAVLNYSSKDFIAIDCFNDEYYNSPFESITPLTNSSELKVYSNTNVVGSLCSFNRFQNVTVENIKFNGNNYLIGNYQTNQNDWNMLYLGGSKNITIRDCIFGNAIMAGIHIGGAGNIYAEAIHDFPENVLIDNCYFYNNGRNDLEIIQGKNITITNCNGWGTLDIEANGKEILENVHISNCNFNSTTPYRPSNVVSLSNINYTDCSFNTIVCQRGMRINLTNVKCHSLRPYQETIIKGENCLIDKIDQVYGNEHLHFVNTTFLGLSNANPGSSYGNSKWYFDNCVIDLSLIKAFKLYNNKMIYMRDSIWTCDTEITGNDVKSIMHFYNTEIHNIRITASNNVERNIFEGCTFTSTSGHHSFGWNVMSGIFKNCYIKTDIRSTYGRMTFLNCILGATEQPVIGGSSRGSLIDGLKSDDPSGSINWDWVYGGGESKLIFKNVWYDVSSLSLGIKAGTAAISSSTVSDESYYLYGNNSADYIKGKIVYSNTSIAIEKVAPGGIKIHYDTVAQMKADTDLSAGRVVETSGYYTKGDGGASKYLIRAAASGETDNGGSIIILNNSLVAELIVEKDSIHVMQFGMSQGTDITTKLNALATFVASANVGNIIFATNGDYELSGAVVFNTDTLTIYGNNTKIRVQDGIYRALRVYGDSLSIYDLTIDGNDTRQDQWSDTRYPGSMTNIYALNTDCTNVYLQNFNIYNLWGQGIMLLDYNKVIINNCTFNKIGGGFYYTDPETGANDNFGDAIHLGGHDGIADVVFNNFYAEGYTTDLNGGKKSRGGLVLEDFIGTTYTPEKTYVTMNNCQLINFNRAFHYEGPIGPTTIRFNNGKVIQDDSICVPEYACNLIIESSEINHTELDYGGSRSFRGYNAWIRDSVINIATNAQNSLAHACKCEYENCTINNINKTSLMNGAATFRKCTLNMNGLATYFMYNSTGKFYDCTFNNSSTSADLTMTESGSKMDIYNCTFNNIKPYGNFKDINSKLYLVSNASDELIGKYSKTTLYINNALRARPSINQVFNATNEVNFDNVFVQTVFGSNTSIDLFPSTLPNDFVWKPNSKYLIIFYGAAGDYERYVTKFANGCYFATAITNTSGVPHIDGAITPSTSSPASYNRELSFDTTNNKISKGTASSNVYKVMYWLLPYNYKNEIGQI